MDRTEHILPPVIRVFISSTFADMDRERHYFNTVLVPQLSKVCEERGVSFFSVDLRWGITKEDQINGDVVPICLREIDRCRPFFIGILGNRYGSLLNNVTPATKKAFPWLENSVGKSITELEMYYGVLHNGESQDIPDCAFFFRSETLSKEFFPEEEDEEKQEKLARLKDEILDSDSIPAFDYDSLEEFGEHVLFAVKKWLNEKFPSMESTWDARKKWYDSELLRDYIAIEDTPSFLDQYCASTTRSLLITGKGSRGKTAALTAWMPSDGKKILINCGSDDVYRYWPNIARDIVARLQDIDESVGYPDFHAEASMLFWLMDAAKKREDDKSRPFQSYVTDHERSSFQKGFITWLRTIEPKVPVYIVINDLNLLDDRDTNISWLPRETQKNIHVVCSANDWITEESARAIGWNVSALPLLSEEQSFEFLDSYMGIFGKKLSEEQRVGIATTPLIRYPGYVKCIVRYLNNYGKSGNMDELTCAIGKKTSVQDLYHYLLESIAEGLSVDERKAAYTAFAILGETRLGLPEADVYDLVQQFTPLDAIGWSKVCALLNQFQLAKPDTWKIDDDDLRMAIRQLPVDGRRVHKVLSDYFFGHMRENLESALKSIWHNTGYAKSALVHLAAAKEWDALAELLQERSILYYLTKMEWTTVRSMWAQLLLHSDIDVRAQLMRCFEKCDDKYANIENIKQKLIGLMVDLELEEQAEEAVSRSGLEKRPDFRSAHDPDLSKNHMMVYKRFCSIREAGRGAALPLLEEITSFLDENESELSPIAYSSFLMLKLDCEIKTGNTQAALATASSYCAASIASMDEYQILISDLMRVELLNQIGYYAEVTQHLPYIQQRALNLGGVREYLSATNISCLCANRLHDFENAEESIDMAMQGWRKLGNEQELFVCWINKSIVLHMKGDDKAAIENALDLYRAIKHASKDEYSGLAAKVMGNLGTFYEAIGEDDEAEAAFKEALTLEKERSDSNGNNLRCLATHYKRRKQFTKAIAILKDYVEFLYRRMMLQEAVAAIQECVSIMRHAHFYHDADAFIEKWNAKFERIPGGRAFLERKLLQERSKSLLVEQLENDLVIARSRDDHKRCGEILEELASLSRDNDNNDSCDLLVRALDDYSTGGSREEAVGCARKLIALLARSGRKDRRFEKACSFFSPADNVVIDRWLSLQRTSIDDQTYSSTIEDIIQNAGAESEMSTYCLALEAKQLMSRADEKTVRSVAKWFRHRTQRQLLENNVLTVVNATVQKDIGRLCDKPFGSDAERLIAKLINEYIVLEAFGNVNAGMLAGSLAIIHRSRKERVKALTYHKKAIAIYWKHNQQEDIYIEQVSLATTYTMLGEPGRGIELLRALLKQPELADYGNVHASVAGNLASSLMDISHFESAEEIITCFAIEEDYFEKAGEVRELMISLINQMKYYLAYKPIYDDRLSEVFKKAVQLSKTNHITEFDSTLFELKAAIIGPR